MPAANSVTRFSGLMLLAQLLVAPLGYFGLLRPGTARQHLFRGDADRVELARGTAHG
jgi:hypothetical protein